ncbi:tannase/feruloyl esterase family alpha/beta hydrolase [Phenylobacterium sp.]|uniref:tannase/feruloyl esterase family alpha/beta hydrolase n=1 Tax=Phenylobacterium sp. TaxID=1871053 RepID=UPI0025CC24FD|nr:tannase/feruloyl esterase family alpha/beta hydrolase [Phenylobacterium sp.]
MRTVGRIAGALACFTGVAPGAYAQPFPAATKAMATTAVERCLALQGEAAAAKYAVLRDAPTGINSARVIPAGGTHGVADDDLPEICRVEGTIAPTIGFLLRMPTRAWNGKFMMGGCGGPCGNYLEDRIDQALVRNYAVVTTDMGHKGSGWLFAYNNPQGQTDFAYRATHLTAVVAKEIVADYYGRAASYNYFVGCSTGGRQALIEAQRFPTDFNGILSGAPVYDEIGDTPYFLEWNNLVNTGRDGRSILTREMLPDLHKAVLSACDQIDGLKDGLIQNPLTCAFDPKTIVCKPGAATGFCLTREQADVVQKFHDGARNSKGEKLYFGMPWGSEEQWALFIGADGRQHWPNGTSITGFMGFERSPGGSYRLTDFDYDRDPARLDMPGVIQNPVNPDLSRFRWAGGKLILFHGWNDNNIPAQASIEYYQAAQRANGGEAATRQFFRFFMPPAINHCRGGEGGGEIDWITALEGWVEKGQAPDQVIAYRPVKPYPTTPRGLEDYGLTYSKFGRHPLARDYYDTARPVYAYPVVAKYLGKGDPADARSWGPAGQ